MIPDGADTAQSAPARPHTATLSRATRGRTGRSHRTARPAAGRCGSLRQAQLVLELGQIGQRLRPTRTLTLPKLLDRSQGQPMVRADHPERQLTPVHEPPHVRTRHPQQAPPPGWASPPPALRERVHPGEPRPARPLTGGSTVPRRRRPAQAHDVPRRHPARGGHSSQAPICTNCNSLTFDAADHAPQDEEAPRTHGPQGPPPSRIRADQRPQVAVLPQRPWSFCRGFPTRSSP